MAAVRPARGLLRVNAPFRSLWSAWAVSRLGDRFSMLAVPVLALTEAGATAGQVALLWAVQSLPGTVLAMPVAAAMVGRPERAMMVACDLLRPVLLCAVVFLAWSDGLRLWHLFGCMLLVGFATTVFDVCAQAYLPRIVDRAHYAEANGRVAQTTSAADVAGPVLAGLLTALAGASAALLVDAASFLLSAAVLALVRDTPRQAVEPDTGLWDRLRDGARFVREHRTLRVLVAAFASYNLGSAIVAALWYPYLLDRLDLSPSLTGALITVGGMSAMGAALVVNRVVSGGRPRVLLPLSLSGIVAALWLVPLAALGHPVVLLATYQLVFGLAVVFFTVTAATMRQSITPLDHQGRVYAVVYTFSLLTVPLGAALASAVAAATSLVTAMFTGALIASTSLLTIRTFAAADDHRGTGRPG